MGKEATQSVHVLRSRELREAERVFCGHCGREPEEDRELESRSRVCERCGMGLLLRASADAAPAPADPFLVIDGSLTVCAMSRQAEKLLGVTETEAVNRHITDFLVPAEVEGDAAESFAACIAWSARGEATTTSFVVRPTNTFGLRYWARIGRCGPPSAALVVLADAT
jgi:PAS domain-containing protein